jgi:hypothetical protein
MKNWVEVLKKLAPTMKGAGTEATRRRRAASEFISFAEERLIPLDADEERTVELFKTTLEGHKKANGTFNKAGTTAVEVALELLRHARGEGGRGEGAEPASDSPAPDTAPELDSSTTDTEEDVRKPQQQPQEEQFEEDLSGDEALADESEQFEDEAPTPPPPRRPTARPPPPQRVVYAPGHRRPARPAVERAMPRSAMRDLMPRSEKVRIYKRDEMGKRVLIDDFSLDEIGSMPLALFVKDYLHGEYGNEQSSTKYEFYELDKNGREKSPPGEVNLAPVAGGGHQQDNDPLQGVRRAMDVVNELQHFTQPGQKNPMLEAAQQRALGSGDFNGMMMMMMMEKLMGGSGGQNEILLKVLDRIDRLEGTKRPSPSQDFGPPPGFGGPFMPPMPFGPPPSFREEPRHSNTSDKLLDIALAKMANPPTLADSIKELMALQSMMQPQRNDSSEVQALRAELRQAMSSTPKGGIEDSLANFEKLTTIVKSVAPQIQGDGGGSGVAGFIKGIFSNPEVGKAIGGIISAAQPQQVQQVQQLQAPQPQQLQQVAQQHIAQPPKPRDPNQPPNPPPQAVLDAVRIFRFAQTPEVQAQRFVDLVFAMYTSEDPYYVGMLNPALADLNKADQHIDYLRLPRKTAISILANLRPSLATPDFTDACLAALAQKAGAELPQTLINTRGKWSLENGEVKMLEEVGAKPVPAEDVLKDTQVSVLSTPTAEASPTPDLAPALATA